eukprot:scaffold6036_cov371-Prasinococcus_capsulatus_cf.AAC.5
MPTTRYLTHRLAALTPSSPTRSYSPCGASRLRASRHCHRHQLSRGAPSQHVRCQPSIVVMCRAGRVGALMRRLFARADAYLGSL